LLIVLGGASWALPARLASADSGAVGVVVVTFSALTAVGTAFFELVSSSGEQAVMAIKMRVNKKIRPG
jgi:hypothetical protein